MCKKLAERMFFQFVLLVVSFMSFLCICSVSSCDKSCTNCPEFTASRLVVKYGDQASAACVACKDGCNFNFTNFGLEKPVGTSSKDSETNLSWHVDNLTEWNLSLLCYFTVNNVQCISELPVTVYQPPQEVSISFVNHTGPMSEGGRYTLQCDVLNVAPIQKVTVTFYRGQSALGHLQSSNTNKKLVNESFTLSFNASKEDDGAEFWCEAKLELGAEGPQPPPVVKSGHLTAAVQNKSCTNVPEFTPSRLVVKYGDQASAACVACKDGCNFNFTNFGLEKPVGTSSKDSETKLSWHVDNLTEWNLSLLCYFTVNNVQCISELPVTVYQPPQEVSISFVNHTGPMSEGGRYTLQCDVLNVAPIQKVTVTFYRGQTALGHLQSSNTNKKLVNESFTLSFNASKEDDGAEFWCETKLELGAEGPQPPPVVKSGHLTATVYYEPVLDGSANRETITIKEGGPLQLNCSAVGNPDPSYTWTLPFTDKPHNDSVFTVGSVGLEHEGEYICKVRNIVNEIQVTFKIRVEPKPNIIIILIIAFIVTAALVIVFLIGYFLCYKPNRMGQYNFKDVFRFPKQHIAVPLK
ncbi:vascular cell adhesion protein 1-like [Odontesthes bonariensis]|uniref:vascular cell adhesion protein 1-like n=1 Tax=Odontesthes bonariensis TaxID=219752 RepID=UPI003F58CF62